MKNGQNYSSNRQRRPRRASNNNNRRQNNNNPNQHWESLGPNVRIRGSATQIYDKYVSLSEDAKRNGDRVLVENLKQHAEHYLRIMNQQRVQRQERQARQQIEAAEQSAEAEETENTPENSAINSAVDAADDTAIVEDLTPKNTLPSTDTDDADAAAMD